MGGHEVTFRRSRSGKRLSKPPYYDLHLITQTTTIYIDSYMEFKHYKNFYIGFLKNNRCENLCPYIKMLKISLQL